MNLNARRRTSASSFPTGFAGYIISLSACDCKNPDVEQLLLNADDLLRQFVGWYTKERKRKSEILHQNNDSRINRLQWACRSPDQVCASVLNRTPLTS